MSNKSERNELYLDLQKAGGLLPALQKALEKLGTDLIVKDGYTVGQEVVVEKGTLKAQVSLAEFKRKFHVDLYSEAYLSGTTGEFPEVTRAIEMFLVQEATTARMKQEFSWIEFVLEPADRDQWRTLVRKIEDNIASGERPYQKRLLPLVMEAIKRPQLRRVSVRAVYHELHLSNPTRDRCGCIARPTGDGLFIVQSRFGEPKVLGEGDAVQAADILVEHLGG